MRIHRRLLIGVGAAALAFAAAAPAVAKVPIPVPRPAVLSQAAVTAHVAAKAGARAEAPVRVDAPMPSGVSGWMAVDLDTGQVLDQWNADTAFAPASVAKLPTAAFALDMLGAGHRFRTRVLATGPVRNGEVLGDLVLQGGGDPELDTDALLPLAGKLAESGVRSVTGGLVADGSALPQVSEITSAQEVDAAYNPSVSGLNLNFNRVHVKWDARKGHELLAVEAAAAKLSPAVGIVRVSLASAPGAPLFTYRQAGGLEMWEMARWAYRGRAARWLPVKSPETYAAEVFRGLVARHGIELPAPRPGLAPSGTRVLATIESRPLAEILRDMLKHSTNLTAEVTGSAATRAAGVDARTLADSARVMNTWAAQVAGFPIGDPGFRLVNHSGLTLESRLSPRRMVELLAALAPRAGSHAEGLPDGVARYLRPYPAGDGPAKLQVVAKTGTMSYVVGLAGYMVTPGGRRLAFAIFSNDLARRGNGPERVDKRWLAQARAFERALIRGWAARADV
jgi:serine-type D-Ala-D-Ala carboxypeptidase/endopeptidase (penicillin-binding protein 4)